LADRWTKISRRTRIALIVPTNAALRAGRRLGGTNVLAPPSFFTENRLLVGDLRGRRRRRLGGKIVLAPPSLFTENRLLVGDLRGRSVIVLFLGLLRRGQGDDLDTIKFLEHLFFIGVDTKLSSAEAGIR